MRDFHLLSYLVKKINIPRCRRVSRATPYSRALRACVRGVVRRVIARAHARPKVQPSTGGSEAGSTPTYNCGFPLAAPEQAEEGLCPTESEGWWMAAAPVARRVGLRDARGPYVRAGGSAAAGRRERGRGGWGRKGGCRQEAAAGRLHAPTSTTACVVPAYDTLATRADLSLARLSACLFARSLARGHLGAPAPCLHPPSRARASSAGWWHSSRDSSPPPPPSAASVTIIRTPSTDPAARAMCHHLARDVMPFFLSVLRFLRSRRAYTCVLRSVWLITRRIVRSRYQGRKINFDIKVRFDGRMNEIRGKMAEEIDLAFVNRDIFPTAL